LNHIRRPFRAYRPNALLSGNFVDGAGQVTGREQEKGLFECYRLELGFGRLGLFGLGDSQCTSANLFSRN
jgi:hypothetical protein